jgi:TonB family protein
MHPTILIIIAALAFATEAKAAEPTFKQEPSGDLRRYFSKMVRPNYPAPAVAMHKKGDGWYRLEIDRTTGAITGVKVLKSTGVKILDDSAAVAFMQSRARPNMIDHAVVHFTFGGSMEETGSHIKW